MKNELWYRQPAREWEEALPLGNGRMGAMVFGGVAWDRIQVNEESIWYGGGMARNNPDMKEHLDEIRNLLAAGRIREAEKLIGMAMTGCPNSMHCYQTLGDILFRFDGDKVVSDGDYRKLPVEDCASLGYRRSLTLEDAVAETRYEKNKTVYTREFFLSHPADCMMMRFRAEGPEGINFTAKLARSKYFDGVGKWGDDGIWLHGNLGRGGYEFAMGLRVRTVGGSVKIIGESIFVENAAEAELCFCADTTYHYSAEEMNAYLAERMQGWDGDYFAAENAYRSGLKTFLQEKLKHKTDAAMDTGYDVLKQEHIKDYRAMFERVKLTLNGEDRSAVPTDERLNAVREGAEDTELERQLFDFGRYLMIACSRPDGLPATLQGLWNHEFMPPWDCKYTININTEMNYWMAESCNLAECHEPLFELMKKMRQNGRETARVMYGCRGMVAHHNTDIHGDTAPQDIWYPGTYWVMGAAWLATHIRRHYRYTLDREFLKEMFPILAESALFFADFLVERNGMYVTSPSVSPENSYILPNGETGACCEGPTMDSQILRELFTDCIEMYSELGEEEAECEIPDLDSVADLMEQLKELLDKLPPTRVGSDGRILEWLEEYGETEPGHRHVSHLYGLFPGTQISMDETPEMAQAARRTLEYRLEHGGGHTGWSRAWIMNHYAKLWDGDKAHESIRLMLANSTYPNLFDKHPPFQIDGNFGACSAIAQMLVQCPDKKVILLPALPKEWADGKAEGLRLAGNAQLSMEWKNAEPVSVKIRADSDYKALLVFGTRSWSISAGAGETIDVDLAMLN